MASFKNIEKNTSENASYSAYKKLTLQDVDTSWYTAKKYYTVETGIRSLIYDRYIEPQEPEAIPCDGGTQYSGGEAFPTTTTVNLGEETGTVVFDFNAYSVPDKFIVEYDGAEVINTGYRGAVSYQSQLDTLLANRGLPSETITYPGSGTVSFNKTVSSPTTATVKVYGPFPGTGWNFTLYCPAAVSPTPTPTLTPTVTPPSSPDATPTLTPSVTPTKTPAPTRTPSKTPSVTPTKTPAPTRTPSKTPSITPTLTPTASTIFSGWEFTAGAYGAEVGYKQSVINGCPALFGMFGSVGSSYTAGAFPGIDCYKIGPNLYTKGIGITGKGNASPYLLGRFYDTGGGSLSMMLAKADGSTFNGTENITLSGTINGSNGTSSSWNCSFGAFPQYVDDDGNGTLDYYVTYGSLGMTGLTLTSGVTYTVQVTSGL